MNHYEEDELVLNLMQQHIIKGSTGSACKHVELRCCCTLLSDGPAAVMRLRLGQRSGLQPDMLL